MLTAPNAVFKLRRRPRRRDQPVGEHAEHGPELRVGNHRDSSGFTFFSESVTGGSVSAFSPFFPPFVNPAVPGLAGLVSNALKTGSASNIIAANNVVIVAQDLNLDGTLQSGIQDYNVHITSAYQTAIDAANNARS